MKKSVILALLISIVTIGHGQDKKVQAIDSSFIQFLNIRDFTISKNSKEAYFTVQSIDESSAIIVRSELINGHWSEFKMVEFSGKYRDIEPFLSPNNLRLYFSSNRPKDKSSNKPNDYDIWYVKRKTLNDNWSPPINIGAPVNTSFNEFYPSVSKNNNIYYTSDSLADTNKDDIFFSEWDGNQYLAPISETNVNSEKYEFNSFISPNEDFLIYTVYGAKEGLGSGDLYISHKNKDGKFGTGKNMGTPINSDKMDYCPFYDLKNKILYFTSKRNEINFTEVNGLSEFKNMVDQYANGLSRIYKVSIDLSSANNDSHK